MKKMTAVAAVATLLLCAPLGSGNRRVSAAADTAPALSAAFDVVETFDDLQDWDGNGKTGYYHGDGAPRLSDGRRSKWDFFSNDRTTLVCTRLGGEFVAGDTVEGGSSGASGKIERVDREEGQLFVQLAPPLSGEFRPGERVSSRSGASATFLSLPKWIAHHGPELVWGGRGKSLCINYNDFSGGIAGRGPSRLGLYLGKEGDSKSGYRKVHLFMMVKFHPGFFKEDSKGTFTSVGVLKMFDLGTGFTSTGSWGSPEERARLNQESGRLAQLLSAYGPNASIVNVKGGGFTYPRTLFYCEHPFTARMTPTGIDYEDLPPQDLVEGSGKGTDIAPYYRSGEWFGIEFAAETGTAGKADAATEMWIYDRNGKEKGHFSASGERRLAHFPHRYNKVTLGGNRLCNGYGTCPSGQDNRWYVDDVIIHHDRIGPTYFRLLSAARGKGASAAYSR